MSGARLHRSLRCRIGVMAALCFAVATAAAQTSVNEHGIRHQGTVISDDVLYTIGGGRAVLMGDAPRMRSISVGIGWNSNLICGDMSLSTTVRNQLNGLTDGFQNIMSAVIQSATAAVASLPALLIQRADPGLYNLLTNGVLQARLDFDRSKLTCRAIANKMADIAGGQLGWDQLAEGMALKQAVNRTDAVSAIDEAEASRGNTGVPWVGGENAGGANQRPIRVVADVSRAGYNLLNGRDVEDASTISLQDCNGNLACETWRSPADAATWSVRVLGEQEQRTCEACTKTVATAGVGLSVLIQEEFDTKLEALRLLVAGTSTTPDALRAASSGSLPITRGVIEALRDEPDQDILARRLASEVALASVMEKALVLQRILLSGRKEPNVAANQIAQQAIAQESDILDREIRSVQAELTLRRELAANSPAAIVQRHRARTSGSRGVVEGDPVPNRLDELQRRRDPPTP